MLTRAPAATVVRREDARMSPAGNRAECGCASISLVTNGER